MLTKMLKLGQKGDTLIEITIAIVIIGNVLFAAYVLANKAFQISIQARERSQATQIIQSQAEGLRALRDQTPTWSQFCALFNSSTLNAFHMEHDSLGHWHQVKNDPNPPNNGFWDPSSLVGGDPELPSGRYRVQLSGTFTAGQCTAISADPGSLRVTAYIKWDRYGGGPLEESRLYTRLTNSDLLLEFIEEQ